MDIWGKLDAAEVSTSNYEIIPEGIYIAEVTDLEIKEELFPDGVKISVEFTIKAGDLAGRKCWWSSKMNEQSSPAALSFIKSQICALAGVKSTEGKPMEILAECKGVNCMIQIKHSSSVKDPSKTFTNVYIKEKLA